MNIPPSIPAETHEPWNSQFRHINRVNIEKDARQPGRLRTDNPYDPIKNKESYTTWDRAWFTKHELPGIITNQKNVSK